MAATTGSGAASSAASNSCSVGPPAAPPNSVISAPAMKTRPALTMSSAFAPGSDTARSSAADRPDRTARLIALTGGLLISATPTDPWRVYVTVDSDWTLTKGIATRAGERSVRDVQPVSARRRAESFAKSARKMAGRTEPAIPRDFRNCEPIEAPVAQQSLRPVEPAGIQFLAERGARGGEQQMYVTP